MKVGRGAPQTRGGWNALEEGEMQIPDVRGGVSGTLDHQSKLNNHRKRKFEQSEMPQHLRRLRS